MYDDFEPDDEFDDELDIADEVSLADTGRRWGVAPITHPTMLATRRHFAEHPLPGQRAEGGAAA